MSRVAGREGAICRGAFGMKQCCALFMAGNFVSTFTFGGNSDIVDIKTAQ